jgi:small subunit ribosomal protein S1
MSPRTIRRRPGTPEDAEPEALPEPEAVAAPAPPPPPAVKREESPRLSTDDLMALVDMDPRELAALMDQNLRTTQLEEGMRVTGRIARVGRDELFVELGGKAEGQLDLSEAPNAKAGDEITAFVVSIDEDGVQLSMKLSGSAAAEHLDQAKETKVPVEGKVMSRNAGGFEVRIGGARAFCPMSHISRLPEVDLDAFVGQTLPFRVLETGDKIVVSRRVIQEEEMAVKAGELWSRLELGQEYRGVVRNVLAFGAFVDIGGVEGLVPRREISWAGNAEPSAALRAGQALEVRVIALDPENRKLTLSARAPDDDPWNAVGTEFMTGGVYSGKVVKLESFGAFIELSPGLTGLAHGSRLAGVALSPGDRVDVRLVSVDHERKRLELAPVSAGEAAEAEQAEAAAEPEQVQVNGIVAEVLANGVVVSLSDGRTGWLPAREVDLPAGTVLNQRYRKGKPVTARVVGTNGARVDLTARSEEEDKGWRTAMRRQERGGGSLGTFADLLGGLKLPKK